MIRGLVRCRWKDVDPRDKEPSRLDRAAAGEDGGSAARCGHQGGGMGGVVEPLTGANSNQVELSEGDPWVDVLRRRDRAAAIDCQDPQRARPRHPAPSLPPPTAEPREANPSDVIWYHAAA